MRKIHGTICYNWHAVLTLPVAFLLASFHFAPLCPSSPLFPCFRHKLLKQKHIRAHTNEHNNYNNVCLCVCGVCACPPVLMFLNNVPKDRPLLASESKRVIFNFFESIFFLKIICDADRRASLLLDFDTLSVVVICALATARCSSFSFIIFCISHVKSHFIRHTIFFIFITKL